MIVLSPSQVILTVYLNDTQQMLTEVPITPATRVIDVVEYCKEAGEGECHLAEVWNGHGESVGSNPRPLRKEAPPPSKNRKNHMTWKSLSVRQDNSLFRKSSLCDVKEGITPVVLAPPSQTTFIFSRRLSTQR